MLLVFSCYLVVHPFPFILKISNGKRRSFAIAEKVKIIECLECKVFNKYFCRELEISQSTLYSVESTPYRNQKIKYKVFFVKDATCNKRIKFIQHRSVEQALLERFKIQRSKNIPIKLQEKETEFGKIFNRLDFQCFSFWIPRFRQRPNIVFGQISEESASVPAGVSENWLGHIWPNLRENYANSNI